MHCDKQTPEPSLGGAGRPWQKSRTLPAPATNKASGRKLWPLSGFRRHTRHLPRATSQALALAMLLPLGLAHAAGDPEAWNVKAWGAQTSSSNLPVAVSNMTGVVSIAAGDGHTLVMKSDGTIWAWGSNFSGELGRDTNFVKSHIPVAVRAVPDLVTVAARSYTSMALKGDGTVWAWGGVPFWPGALTVPRQVPNVAGIVAISGCIALKRNGTVWEWCAQTPSQVRDLTDVAAISAGGSHNLALKRDGTVWAWGDNDSGQLGNGTNSDSSVPVKVSNLNGVLAVAGGGASSLAVKNDGTVWAWGANEVGQLGNGTQSSSNVPVKVNKLTDVVAVAAGSGYDGDYSLALRKDGTVWAWGFNRNGQLGNGSNTSSNVPVRVSYLTGVVAIAAGARHSVALTRSGGVWGWGDNSSSQLATLTVGNVSGVVGIAPVYGGGLALTSDGRLSQWEYPDTVPAPPNNLTQVVAMATGQGHRLALKDDGRVWAWGQNNAGQLGDGSNTDTDVPVPVSKLNGVVAISAGLVYSLALKNDGTVWAWGDNWYGQLGNGSGVASNIPVQVTNLTSIVAVDGGDSYSLALKSDGTVWSWGNNRSGQLGNGTNTDSYTPAPVSNLTGVVAIAAGSLHSLAVRSDGTVRAWGVNYAGQLGNGSNHRSAVPVKVRNLARVVAVAVGDGHSLALLDNGTVWGWGRNWYNQVIEGNNQDRYLPVRVNYINGAAVAIAAGREHSVAVVANGIPGVTIDRRSFNFSSRAIGTSSPPQAFTITNSGTTPLVIDSVMPTGPDAGNFSRTSDTCAGATLAPLAVCDVQIQFAPTTPGGHHAAFLITSNGPGSPHLILLRGIGTGR